MRNSLCSVLVFLVLLVPVRSYAIVNVEQAIIGPQQDGLHTDFEVAVDSASGNTQKRSAKADLRSQWQHGVHSEFLQVQYAYGSSRGKLDTDRKFAHLRHHTLMGERWGLEEFAQAGQDPFARIALRTLLGGGVRWVLHEEAEHDQVFLGLGGFYEREQLSQVQGTTDPVDSRLWRGNSYLVWKHQVNEQLRFYSTSYYQPRLSGAGDYRLLEQASILVKLVDTLNLKLSLDAAYDSQPPQTVQKTDVRFSTGLTWTF